MNYSSPNATDRSAKRQPSPLATRDEIVRGACLSTLLAWTLHRSAAVGTYRDVLIGAAQRNDAMKGLHWFVVSWADDGHETGYPIRAFVPETWDHDALLLAYFKRSKTVTVPAQVYL